jgi:hypothetical protein
MASRAYEHLHDHHMKFHKIKDWLIRGTYEEDARTIREAIRSVPSRRIKRRLARALLKG